MGACLGKQAAQQEKRANNWAATGIVSLRDQGLSALPAQVKE